MQQGTRWTALETTNHNPRWGVSLSPSRLLNYSSMFGWASQEKNSPGKISIPLGRFPLLRYKGIEKHLFVLSCYCVLDLVFCTQQQVLSNLLLVLTMWGYCFTHFTEEKTKCSERLVTCPRLIQFMRGGAGTQSQKGSKCNLTNVTPWRCKRYGCFVVITILAYLYLVPEFPE